MGTLAQLLNSSRAALGSRRREFLIGASTALGGLLAPGLIGPASAQTNTTVKVWNLEGGSGVNVTARLWMLSTVLGTGTGTGNQQQDEGSDPHTGVVGSFSVSFPLGPSFQSVSVDKGVGLSLQDTSRVTTNDGWWFRSGRFDTLPTDFIEVVLASASNITPAQIASMVPATPFTADAGTSTIVTVLSVTLMDPVAGGTFSGGFIRLVAVGTTKPSPLVAPVGFTYSLDFQAVPSSSIELAASQSIEISSPTRGSIVFSGSGSTAAFEATILNLLNGKALGLVFPVFRDRLQAAMNAGAIASAASVIGSGTTLPNGVILSVRTLQTRATPSTTLMSGITFRAALGAFGGVISKFPAVASSNSNPTSTCFIATAATGAESREVAVLRYFRDDYLTRFALGRRFVSFYERVSPPLAERLRHSKHSRLAVRWFVVRPAAVFAQAFVWFTRHPGRLQ